VINFVGFVVVDSLLISVS